MDRETIKKQIIEIIADILPDQDLSSLSEEESLREQLGMDSMDVLDIAMEFRKNFKIAIEDEDLVKLSSLNSCIEYLDQKISSKSH